MVCKMATFGKYADLGISSKRHPNIDVKEEAIEFLRWKRHHQKKSRAGMVFFSQVSPLLGGFITSFFRFFQPILLKGSSKNSFSRVDNTN